MDSARAYEASQEVERMKEKADRLERIIPKGHDVYGDVLMLRAALDSIASDLRDICDDMPSDVPEAPKPKANINDFAVGDRVRVGGINMRPMYLRGAEGNVTKVTSAKVHVKLDVQPSYKRYSGVVAKCPPAIVEKI